MILQRKYGVCRNQFNPITVILTDYLYFIDKNRSHLKNKAHNSN